MISLTWTWPNFIDSGENKVLDKNVKRLWTGCQFTGSFYKPGCNSRKQTNRTLYQISQLWAGSKGPLILFLNPFARSAPLGLFPPLNPVAQFSKVVSFLLNPVPVPLIKTAAWPAGQPVWSDCQCTMVPLSTRICLKSKKLRPILNGQFWHAISKNICLNVFGSKQPWEILVFVIFKL